MKLNLVLQRDGKSFPVIGDTLSFHVPCTLEVIKRDENEIVFEITEINKPNPDNFKETLTDAGSLFSTNN